MPLRNTHTIDTVSYTHLDVYKRQVQGSFMNKNYGLLNGNAVDWSAYTGYGVVNTLVWVVCILVPLIAMLIWKQKKVRPVFLFLSCALILMQGASLVVSFINYPTVTESATPVSYTHLEWSAEAWRIRWIGRISWRTVRRCWRCASSTTTTRRAPIWSDPVSYTHLPRPQRGRRRSG